MIKSKKEKETITIDNYLESHYINRSKWYYLH